MTKFKRESRYIVLKNKDVDCLSAEDKQALQRILHRIEIIRIERGRTGVECVVVESDWPECQLVWGLLEYRAALTQLKGTP